MGQFLIKRTGAIAEQDTASLTGRLFKIKIAAAVFFLLSYRFQDNLKGKGR
ncbi:hypothetical protein [Neobacillus sp. FSL H8-0543]|uniref:hypothetical protein n=1 Tax=Neobacillus sp. FSL H8-0543 TaxID=2954672 RepID=UPI00315924FB